jgi:hypothetical protein
MLKDAPHREDCDGKQEPIGLIFGSRPGRACVCRFEQLTASEFKAEFGFEFRPSRWEQRAGYEVLRTGGAMVMRSKGIRGNARDRRKAKRSQP